jgi:hypothetical protein
VPGSTELTTTGVVDDALLAPPPIELLLDELDEAELAEEGTVADELELEFDDELLEEADEAEEKVGDEAELTLEGPSALEAEDADERRLVADDAELPLELAPVGELALEPLEMPIDEAELALELGELLLALGELALEFEELGLEPDELSLDEFELEGELSLDDDEELGLEKELALELGDEGELGGVADESELDGDELLLDDDEAELPDDDGELPLEADDELALEADDGLPADEAELGLEFELRLEPDDEGELALELDAELGLDGGTHGLPADEAELGLEGAAPALEADDEGELVLEPDELPLEPLDTELNMELLMESASHRVNECCELRVCGSRSYTFRACWQCLEWATCVLSHCDCTSHTIYRARRATRRFFCAIIFCQFACRYLTLGLLRFLSRRTTTGRMSVQNGS